MSWPYVDKPPFGNPPHADSPMVEPPEIGDVEGNRHLKEMWDSIPKPPKGSELYGGLEDLEDELNESI